MYTTHSPDLLSFILLLQNEIDMAIWEEKQPKIQSFFGPGIVARINKVSPDSHVSPQRGGCVVTVEDCQ